MSAPQDRHVADDLDRAWTDAVARTEDVGPAPSVRANVLAAAREVAAQQARGEAPLTPVSAPVGPVAGTRSGAVNRSSWRMRAGGGLLAALVVGVLGWRLGVHGRDGETAVVASAPQAEMKVAAATGLPAAPAAVAPPDADVAPRAKAAPRAVAPPLRELAPPPKLRAPVVVAQTELARQAAPAPLAEPPALREAADAAALAAPPARAPAASSTDVSPIFAAIARRAPPVTLALAEPPVAKPALVPMPLPAPAESRPVPAAQAVAAAEARQRVDVVGNFPDTQASGVLESAKKSAPALSSLFTASARALPLPPLQAAADRGDLDAIQRLLAASGARVDAPDAAGRSALLHAVLAQRADAVRALLAAGADPARPDAAGLTPRAAAQAGANAEIAQLLAAPR